VAGDLHDGAVALGEWLSSFPAFTDLDDQDRAAWADWLSSPKTEDFLDATIVECRRLAVAAQNARGYAVVEGAEGSSMEPPQNGWIKGNLRIPDTLQTRQNG
jgi:hypothetical protein